MRCRAVRAFAGDSFVPIPSPWHVMPRYVSETTMGAVFGGKTTQMTSSDTVYWELSDMPMITYDIYKSHPPGYLTCSGLEAEE